MDKAERGKLLRARIRAIGGWVPLPRRDLALAKPEPYKSRWKHGARWGYSVGQHLKEMPLKWVYVPNEAPNSTTPQTSRTARQSALQRIADRWDERKLAERLSRH